MQITVQLSDETIGLLAAAAFRREGTELERAKDALEFLAASVADGMRRPGAWEREVVVRIFGTDFLPRLERDPDNGHRMRVRAEPTRR